MLATSHTSGPMAPRPSAAVRAAIRLSGPDGPYNSTWLSQSMVVSTWPSAVSLGGANDVPSRSLNRSAASWMSSGASSNSTRLNPRILITSPSLSVWSAGLELPGSQPNGSRYPLDQLLRHGEAGSHFDVGQSAHGQPVDGAGDGRGALPVPGERACRSGGGRFLVG